MPLPPPEITPALVRRLIESQFPQWADLPIAPVDRQGWDNRTFRLGDELSVRLPSASGYAAAVDKEDRWLPELAPHLPVAVPEPVVLGRPGCGYPFNWSVRRWLRGRTIETDALVDPVRLARDLGAVLRALRAIPVGDGPVAGTHCFYRGCHPSVYGHEVQQALSRLADAVDVEACRAVWRDAVGSAWPGDPVWFHGDVAVGNLLSDRGILCGLIDFGTCGVGDPACDLVPAWTYFDAAVRPVFRDTAGLDDDTWRRARGWALWKALISIDDTTARDDPAWHTLEQVLADPP